MFGKIKHINDTEICVNLKKDENIITNLMNLHVIFESENDLLLGEVKTINEEDAIISLLGSFEGNRFVAGSIKKPVLTSTIRVINENELNVLMGNNSEENLYIGKSPLYNNRLIYTKINDLFSNHFAIFGNSGSGKSCSVSRIIQNIFNNPNFLAFNANLFIFDAYGEYKTALKDINKINQNYQYKFITTNPLDENDNLLQIPPYLLSNDDVALLLGATNHTQITIIERAMKLAKIFSQNTLETEKLKDHLIAKGIQSVIFSNQTAQAKKNDIFSILSSCSTPRFNMNAEIQGIGYTRRLSDCFKVDSKGEFGESVLINDYISKHIDDNLESSIEIPRRTLYSLNDISKALDFTLISEGFLSNKTVLDYAMILKVRLNAIINSSNAKYFDVNKLINLEQYISSLIVSNNKRSQIININLEDIDDQMAKIFVKILSKMIFDFSKSRKERASIPFHLIIEEAHRYVVNDDDKFLLGYNIFERIAKEGRKYGVLIDLISQRPVDISETVVAQMSNFLVLKMTHPKDLEYIEKMLPNISNEIIDKLNSLQAGTLVAFGNAFKIPLIIKMDLPNPLPYSNNCNILERWKANGKSEQTN